MVLADKIKLELTEEEKKAAAIKDRRPANS